MPIYEVKTPDGRTFEVDAPNAEAAAASLSGMTQQAPEKSFAQSEYDKAMVGTQGMVEGLPWIGEPLKEGIESFAGSVGSWVTGRPKEELLEEYRGRQEQRLQENPGNRMVGNLIGGSAPFLAAGVGPATLQKGLGLTGSLGSRVGYGAASGAGIAGTDAAARDLYRTGSVDPANAGGAALIGGGAGVVAPLASRAIGAGAQKGADFVRAAVNPNRQAAIVTQRALDADQAAGLNTLRAGDEAIAARNNQPIINVDRGGETTRALARSAANQSPEARGLMQRTVSDRFETQASRIAQKMEDVAGRVDDVGVLDQLQVGARSANRKAYDAAYNSPQAQSMFTRRLSELMQSPDVRRAMKNVDVSAANEAALTGRPAVRNPFEIADDLTYQIRTNADGTSATPTLQYWDHVQRNLRSAYERARSSGDKTRAAQLDQLRKSLNTELDAVVPAFRDARQGAARFFGAEDALEAGKKIFRQRGMLPEQQKAIGSMSNAERELLKVGYASEVIDAVKSAGDRRNVVNQYFKSPEARQKIEMVFGKQGAKDIEAFVRIETAMDLLRGAMGNSTTARQLIEGGVVGGAGAAAFSGDPSDIGMGALMGAALRRGSSAVGSKINQRVMDQVASMLLSSDPQAMQRAVQLAARSPVHMNALEALEKGLIGLSRGAALATSTE